jgi:hypothetical protein
MGDEVFGPVRKLLGNDASHRLEQGGAIFVHKTDQSPLMGRLGGGRRGGGRSSGVGGGLGGRFSFSPSAFLAFSAGVGPRASGFFMRESEVLLLCYGWDDSAGRFRIGLILWPAGK